MDNSKPMTDKNTQTKGDDEKMGYEWIVFIIICLMLFGWFFYWINEMYKLGVK